MDVQIIQKLPYEIELKIWSYIHELHVTSINNKIKKEVAMFGNCEMDGSIIYELRFQLLKKH